MQRVWHRRGSLDRKRVATMTPAKLAVLAGCMYEIVAITTDRVPTITRIMHNANRNPAGRFVVWLWCGFCAAHFLVEAAEDN